MNNIIKLVKKLHKLCVAFLLLLIIGDAAFATHIPLTVKDVSGSPSQVNTYEIRVSTGKMTDLGNGVVKLNLNGDTSVAGSNTQVQFNNGGTLGADSAFTWTKATDALGVGRLIASSNINGATLNISGVSTFSDTITAAAITASGTVTGNKFITSNNINGATLNISGVSSFGGTMSAAAITASGTVTGNKFITSNNINGATLNISGASTFGGATQVNSSFGVLGAVTLNGATTVQDSLSVDAIAALKKGQSTPGSSDSNYGRLYVKSNNNLYYLPSGSTTEFLLNDPSGASVAGADMQVQFNDGGSALGADSGLTFNKTTDALTAGKLIATNNINGATLNISGVSTFSDTITATAITASGTVTGNKFITSNNINGATLNISGVSSFGGTMSAAAITASGTVTANKFITSNNINGGTLNISGVSTFSDTITAAAITASGTVTGNKFITSNNINGATLNISGVSSFGGTMSAAAITASGTVTGNKFITSNNINGATLNISGASTFGGATQVNSSFGVLGAVTLNGATAIQDSLSVDALAALKKGQSTPGSSDANYGRLYVKSNNNLYYLPSGSTTEFLLNNGNVTGGASVAGADMQVQFNDGGSALGADSGLTFNKTTDALTAGKLIATNNINGATLNISGVSTFSDTITAAAITASGTVTGNKFITSNNINGATLNLSGAANVSGALSVTSTSTLTGAVTAAANFTVDTDTFFVDASANKVGVGTTSPNSSLHVAGSFTLPINTSAKTGAYTVTAADHTVICDATGGAFTITLPTASGIPGRVYVIKKIDNIATVTVDGNGSETIDGSTTYLLNVQYKSVTLQSNGTNWYIL